MNRTYLIKTWITAIVLGPVLLLVAGLLRQEKTDFGNWLSWYPLFLGVGLVASLPALALCYFGIRFAQSRISRPIQLKAITAFLSVGLVAATFLLVIRGSSAPALALAYSVAACIGAFSYRADASS